jgi:hypothetical protein
MEEVASAEAKMNEAKNALLLYIEQRESIDRNLHARLVKVLSELDQ